MGAGLPAMQAPRCISDTRVMQSQASQLPQFLSALQIRPAAVFAQTQRPHPSRAKSPSTPRSAHQSAPHQKTETRPAARCSAQAAPSRTPPAGQRFYPTGWAQNSLHSKARPQTPRTARNPETPPGRGGNGAPRSSAHPPSATHGYAPAGHAKTPTVRQSPAHGPGPGQGRRWQSLPNAARRG